MRLRRFIPLFWLVLAGACADMKALFVLSTALGEHYGTAPKVKLTNYTHLTITFDRELDTLVKADSVGRAQFATEVATFAKAHYPKAAELEDVTVAFANVAKAGPLTVARTDAPYTFAVRDLP